MKQMLVMIMAVVLVGCGKNDASGPEATSDQPATVAKNLDEQQSVEDKAATGKKAVAVTTGVQCRFCENIFPAANIRIHELKCPKNATDQSLKPATLPEPNPKQPKTISEKLITNPIVEKAIRREIEKPTGALTKADLAKITLLSLDYGPKIIDADLRELAKLQQLIFLNLGDTQITDAGLKEVAKCAQLTNLDLEATQITDVGLKEVAKLQQLKRLWLYNTPITDAGLKELAKLQKLELLVLGRTQITDAGLQEVAKMQKLRGLVLDGTQITDAGLKDIAKLQKLTNLYLLGTQITKAGVAELQKALPMCRIDHGPLITPPSQTPGETPE